MITVLIAHHLNENQHILDWCLESVLKQDVDKEIIVLSDAKEPTIVPEGVHLVQTIDGSLYTPGRKINAGIALAAPRSTHFVYLNDDIMLGKDCLKTLQTSCGIDKLITPLCNADDLNILSQNSDEFPKENEKTYGLAQSKEFREKVHSYKPGVSTLVGTHRLYISCFAMSKEVQQKIGFFDENFEIGWEDEDYCLRASVAGIKMGVNTGAFAFHIGSATLSKTRNKERDKKNHDYFIKKWGFYYVPKSTDAGFALMVLTGFNYLHQTKQITLE